MIKILESQLLALRPAAQAAYRASLVAPMAREMRKMPGAERLVPSPLLEERIARPLEAANRFNIFEPQAAFVFCYAHVETGHPFWEHEDLKALKPLTSSLTHRRVCRQNDARSSGPSLA